MAASVSGGSLVAGVSFDAPLQKMTLLVSSGALAAGGRVSWTIPPSAEMRLPDGGVQADSGRVMVSLAAGARVMHRSAVDLVSEAHTFLAGSVSFAPLITGTKTAITIKFTLSFSIAPGASLSLHLPKFTGAAKDVAGVGTSRVCREQRGAALQPQAAPSLPEDFCAVINFDAQLVRDVCSAGSECKQGRYGAGCQNVCDDRHTCNAHFGSGFCNQYGGKPQIPTP